MRLELSADETTLSTTNNGTVTPAGALRVTGARMRWVGLMVGVLASGWRVR